MNVHRQEQIASLIAAGSLIYAVYAGTQKLTTLANFKLPVGAIVICALGAVIWLHAKWRRSTSMNR